MNQESEAPVGKPERSTTLTLLQWLAEWRRFVMYCCFWAAIVSVIVSLVIPPDFKSTASVFPAEETDMFGGIGDVSSLEIGRAHV